MSENYLPWKIEILERYDLQRVELLKHLLGWAILAPNSHNCQPWRFLVRPSEGIVEIHLDQSFVLPISDPTGRQSLISLGSAYENLRLAAQSYGLKHYTEYFTSYIRMRIQDDPPKPPKDPKLMEAMKTRRVNRGKFDLSRALPDNLAAEIAGISNIFGIECALIKDAATRFGIAELQYLADRQVIMRTDFRNELAGFLLPNDTLSCRGMPGSTFRLDRDSALRIHELLKSKEPFDPNLAAGFAITNRDAIKSSPMIAILSVPEDSAKWWMFAGQTLQNIALLCEMLGLATAINAALVEVELFNKMLKIRLGTRYRPTVLVRIGYAVEQMPHSPRVKVDELTEVIL